LRQRVFWGLRGGGLGKELGRHAESPCGGRGRTAASSSKRSERWVGIRKLQKIVGWMGPSGRERGEGGKVKGVNEHG